MRRSITDLAIVLARSDYGEKDRIITVLTPKHGKLRAIAKSVRSGKSRLAGGIELFAENELGLAEGRGELYTVTYSKMMQYFGDLVTDSDKSMYIYECLKVVNKLAPEHAGGEYYDPLKKLFIALKQAKVPFIQVKIWYGLKLLDNLGAMPNLKTDAGGNELTANSTYQYDFDKQCFFTRDNGPYSPAHVKVMRHLSQAGQPAEIKKLDDETAISTERLITMLLNDHIS